MPAYAVMWEGEMYFRSMADSLPVMLWVAGPDRRCSYFNSRWLAYTGRKLEIELSHDWTWNVHPADLADCRTAYTAAFEHRREFQAECRLRRYDGNYRWMLAAAAPHILRGGAFAGYIGTCIDISNIRLTRSQLLTHERLETVGLIAGGIAHDFNNLLGAMIADAELALADLPSGSSCAEGVERIRTVGIRASEIVREIMVYIGQEQGLPTAVDLSLLVEDMAGVLKISTGGQSRLRTELAPDLPAVLAEAAELRQVVMNLILNAADAVQGSGGEIHIATSRATVAPAERGAELPPGEYVRLDVSDTGPGMTADVRDRIFERNFTTKKAGRGLGLSVVRRIVRRYGGTIQCDSAPGKGTRFTVLLPSTDVPAIESDHKIAAAAPTPAPHSNETVLIVEDEESLRLPVAGLLRRRGFQVLEAADGADAIAALERRRDHIDAILLDLTVPGMSAADIVGAAARIRPDVRILLTSAYASQAAGALLAAPQVKGFIRKPYDIRELIRLLVGMLIESPGTAHTTAGIGWW